MKSHKHCGISVCLWAVRVSLSCDWCSVPFASDPSSAGYSDSATLHTGRKRKLVHIACMTLIRDQICTFSLSEVSASCNLEMWRSFSVSCSCKNSSFFVKCLRWGLKLWQRVKRRHFCKIYFYVSHRVTYKFLTIRGCINEDRSKVLFGKPCFLDLQWCCLVVLLFEDPVWETLSGFIRMKRHNERVQPRWER